MMRHHQFGPEHGQSEQLSQQQVFAILAIQPDLLQYANAIQPSVTVMLTDSQFPLCH